ncbi:c-type cytochrome [Chrysiogenes arsenatis]|uniref:c-type cytochrome n=1 Tax=Chrysiogenes arsenatis TaxID=309797 RepID=UPI000408CA9B|nr:c-type cytochrome [Chrysiogenes arsenatis]
MRVAVVFLASFMFVLVSALTPLAADVAAGQALYSGCMGCHGSTGNGGVGPKLSGQPAEQLAAALKKYRMGQTIGARSGMMMPVASNLSDADIENLSVYLSSLK